MSLPNFRTINQNTGHIPTELLGGVPPVHTKLWRREPSEPCGTQATSLGADFCDYLRLGLILDSRHHHILGGSYSRQHHSLSIYQVLDLFLKVIFTLLYTYGKRHMFVHHHLAVYFWSFFRASNKEVLPGAAVFNQAAFHSNSIIQLGPSWLDRSLITSQD